MKNKNMIDSWNKAEPDNAAQERMLQNIMKKSNKKGTFIHWKTYATVTAACVILLASGFILNPLSSDRLSDSDSTGKNLTLADQTKETENNEVAAADAADLSDEIKGLSVKDFKLSDITQNMMMDRIAFIQFLNFFEYNTDSFVIVKVADTKAVPASSSDMSDRQSSTVKVLETIWGEAAPEVITITQHLYGGCFGDEATNLLRIGGVYLLPLDKYKGEYYLNGDLDVLFEIDDQGKIWSHSDYADFNRYDGGDYKEVTKEIIRISRDDALMLATSGFGMALRGWQLLEVTILTDSIQEKDEYGYSETVYSARVESTLSGEEPESEIDLRFSGEGEVLLKESEQYLLFVDNYEGKHYMNSNMLAAVEADDTIKNLGGEGSTFEEYNGYKVEEISELAHTVTEFLSTLQ